MDRMRHQLNWIRIPKEVQERLSNEPRTIEVLGVSFHILISPYDLPTAIRGRYLEGEGIFRIEFKYIDREDETRQRHDEVVTFCLGTHSKKILAIEIRVDHARLDLVQLNLVKKTLSTMRSSDALPQEKLNYSAVNELLNQYKDKLVGSGKR